MVILDTLKYFAQFPSREGVYSMFTNGSSSSFPAYSEVQQYIAALPQARIPDISGFVFGQSFDHVKRRIDALTGTYLLWTSASSPPAAIAQTPSATHRRWPPPWP